MGPDRRDRITELFHAALARTPEAREAFLDEACAGDQELRQEVASLLGFDPTSFLERPAGIAASATPASVAPGQFVGPYRLEALIGSGGTGDVYRASDPKLNRTVAIKILREGVLTSGTSRGRLIREARAASALNHPHIVAIYDIGTADDVDYIAMEHVDGVPLSQVIVPGGLPVHQAVGLAVQITNAMAAAHGNGIVHRDLKPANVLVSSDGHVKIIDFGLSKRVEPVEPVAPGGPFHTGTDTAHLIEGTAGYAAPEQVQGEATDARTDVFAIGAILHEMLTGKPAFDGLSAAERVAATLRDVPDAVSSRLVPRDLQRVVNRALAKRPGDRYTSGTELLADLRAVEQRLVARQVRLTQMLRRPAVAGTAGMLLAVAAAGGTWYRWRESRVEWARGVAMAEAERLIGEQRFDDAYRVLQEAEPYVRDDPEFREHLDVATATWTFTTQPEGAEVMVRDFYGDPDAWRSLGHAPLRDARIPRGWKVFRASMDGFQPVEALRWAERIAGPQALHFTLRSAAETPANMVFVDAPPSGMYRMGDVLGPVPLAGFWIDKYEVTNRQFSAFVAAGVYGTREYWPTVSDSGGRLMSGDRAKPMFVDRTGRPGPSLWQLGSPPEGQDDYPVSGVSWYEAAAYCRWLGKELPTVYHWYHASGFGVKQDAVARDGNFSSDGTQPVGGARRLGASGAYDMAGNVKEWVWNETTSKRRFLLGGGWNEPSYMYSAQDFHDPAERLPTHGFRCATYTGQPAAETFAPIETTFRDYRSESPIGDEAFAVVAALYHYNKRPLEARVERTEDASPYWRLEEVSFAAAYGDERVSALLFLPKNAIPPYQVVVWYPGPVPFTRRMPLGDAERPRQNFEFLIRDGRVIALPAVKGSYNRHLGQESPRKIWAEIMLASSQDIGRLIDYLETRGEFDTERVAYGGISIGASVGPIMTAMEPRFKASVLIAGGLQPHRPPPHADAFNFVPRVKAPTLMVTGKHDFFFPYDRSQRPMFDLLRLPDSQKRLRAFDSGHIPVDLAEFHKEVIAWLEQYLGSVRRQ